MSTTDGDDVPRDPWGNPLPPEDRAPLNPGPDDYLPPFPGDPPGGAPTQADPPAPPANPAWPGEQGDPRGAPPGPPPFAPPAGAPTEAPPAPPVPANPAWPGDQPTPAGPPPAPPGQPYPGQTYPGQPGPGWGGPGVPPQQPAYPPGQYPGGGWGPGAPWVPPKRDGGAIGGLVCGIISITCAGFLGIILGPVALVLGTLSRRRIRESQGRLTGDGMATWAIALGAIGVIVSIVYLVFIATNPDFVQDFLDRLTTTTT